MTVIATGFDKPKKEETLEALRSKCSNRRPSTAATTRQPEPARQGDYMVRTFERDDLDIPAFLRRARSNGR